MADEVRREIFDQLRPTVELKRRVRYDEGEREYGALQWLTEKGATIEMVQEELLDVMNWAELYWMKLEILKRALR